MTLLYLPSYWPSRSRVRGWRCRYPLPSELHVKVPLHAAQAFTNAPRGTWPLSSVVLGRGPADGRGPASTPGCPPSPNPSAAPDPRVNLTVFLRDPQGLTADPASSL